MRVSKIFSLILPFASCAVCVSTIGQNAVHTAGEVINNIANI